MNTVVSVIGVPFVAINNGLNSLSPRFYAYVLHAILFGTIGFGAYRTFFH